MMRRRKFGDIAALVWTCPIIDAPRLLELWYAIVMFLYLMRKKVII